MKDVVKVLSARSYRALRRLVAEYRSATEERSFALQELDLKLRSYLDFRRGFFVEAGANDGVAQSNTLYFERYRKWTGILIEPIPELAEKCRISRPKCIVENCALVAFDFQWEYVQMRYCNLMSLVKGAMKSEEDELEHIELGCELQNVTTYEIEVPARTLTSVLDQYSIRKIDFFSLDVEGSELGVLKGIDFDKHRPDFVLVEALDARYRSDIDSLLNPLYEVAAELSPIDILYRSRVSLY